MSTARPRWRTGLLALIVAATAILPFARGVLTGQAFYFRDLSRHFFPLRRFAVEGLRAGELRYWNPFTHEGEATALLPLAYPLDLLQVLLPDERGFSLLLALHVPLAALAFLALARRLGLGEAAAAGGALLYALGGFALSTVNLYVFLQALAWAPLVALGLRAAASGGSREVVLAAAATAGALTTTAMEMTLQAVLLGTLLAAPWRGRARAARLLSGLGLGAGLAAFVLLPMGALVSGSERGSGLAAEVVLSHSVHPFAFLQSVVGALFGDPANPAGHYWGQNFWPLGFPYILSLYLGALAVALAAVGASSPGRHRAVLLGLLGLGVVVCLGRFGILAPLVESLAPLRRFRFPVKAFFSVHVSVALLAALGLESLARGERTGWKRLLCGALTAGGALVVSALVPRLLEGPTRAFLTVFFPPDLPWPARAANLGFVLRDAATGGTVALMAALLALAVLAGRMAPAVGAATCVALLAGDLVRHGAGLNPMVTPAFYTLSPEMAAELERLREEGGRIFTCDVAQSSAYLKARLLLGERQEAWSFAALRETLTPERHLPSGLPSALSLDLTMLVPRERVAAPAEAACRDLPGLLPRLRAAGVRHVLSLDPLPQGEMAVTAIVRPPAIAPLAVHIYRLEGAPLVSLEGAAGEARIASARPGRVVVDVRAEGPAHLIVRESATRGWAASVDGRPVAADSREGHLAAAVPRGTSRVVFTYRPPGLAPGLALSSVSALVALGLWRRPRGGG